MNNNFKRILTGGIVLSTCAVALAGCGSNEKKDDKASSDDKTTVKLWVTTDSKKFYEKALADFNKENPKVKVNVIETEDAKAQENVKKDPSKAADVFSMPHDQLGQLVDSGVIQEIPEQYTEKIKKDDTENAASGAEYKGKTYAFPYGIESQVLFYNKEKLSAEDVATYENITSKATFGANLKAVNAYQFGPLFMSVGDTLFGENGEDANGTNWNNEKGVAVLQWIADQANNKGFVNVGDDTISKFQNGAIASFESGPWDKDKAVEAVGGEDKLGIAVYPKVTIGGQEVQQKSFLGVKLYAVNQAAANGNAEQIAAAYKLADYLSSDKVQEMQFKDKTRNIVPSVKAIQEADYVKNDEMAQAVVKMSDPAYSVVMPKIPEMTNFWTSSAAVMSDSFNGKIKADQFQAKLDQLMKDISGQK
ncbi:arabinogalactan oligomer / maltooligosaccharide transport system substrate-binding protein [Pilibacter termitis]|uniref:Arabinogalactan oligomer / maltooligosaccharide transport system substrate-binding protein n=1 Tax=Pilibacter termitis TaxID=263852 RepID=A0A1T4MDR9_9ENTE|nr:extracellular solute-binding protein [Pilibacter termitis]SJZ65007.1 arabinogalactan oligomer / maltooligosaccharide transport system substrate-binding protein [Pilibacter termitis]